MIYTQSKSLSRGSAAFTLVELLVVISIIALIISILLPALAATREAGRAIVCGSNLRQQMVGQAAYLVDYGWYTPPSLPANAATMPFNQHLWYFRLSDYLSASYDIPQPGDPDGFAKAYAFIQSGIFACPTVDHRTIDVRSYSINDFGTGLGYDPVTNKSAFWGFMNFEAMNPTPGPKSRELAVRDDSIAKRKRKMSPSDLMFISELGVTTSTISTGVYATVYTIRTGFSWEGHVSTGIEPDFRHSESKNVLFLDGHVGRYKAGGITFQTDKVY